MSLSGTGVDVGSVPAATSNLTTAGASAQAVESLINDLPDSHSFHKYLGVALACVSLFAGVLHGDLQIAGTGAGVFYAGLHSWLQKL